MTTGNPQAFSSETFIDFFREEYYEMHYFFSVKQNVKDIFIDDHRGKEQRKERDISWLIEKVKLW